MNANGSAGETTKKRAWRTRLPRDVASGIIVGIVGAGVLWMAVAALLRRVWS